MGTRNSFGGRGAPTLHVHRKSHGLGAPVLWIGAAGAITAALGGFGHSSRAVVVPCNSSSGPDVIVGEIESIKTWGSVGGIGGYTLGTDACNIGDANLNWYAGTPDHPVIAMNIYRLRKGKFEQIGMSWVKHGFFAEANSFCCTCQAPDTTSELGAGCSDIYSADLNGHQSGFNNMAG